MAFPWIFFARKLIETGNHPSPACLVRARERQSAWMEGRTLGGTGCALPMRAICKTGRIVFFASSCVSGTLGNSVRGKVAILSRLKQASMCAIEEVPEMRNSACNRQRGRPIGRERRLPVAEQTHIASPRFSMGRSFVGGVVLVPVAWQRIR